MIYSKIGFWLITVIIAISIFRFSSQPAIESNNLSTTVTEKIVQIFPSVEQLPQLEKDKFIKDWNNAFRKYAHFTMFFLLGLSAILSIKFSILNKSKLVIWVITLVLCLLYAISDEIHQLFVPGRGCQFKDVMIDFSGSLIGSSIILGFILLKLKIRKFDRR